jgi:hypothetical protein
MQRSGDTAQMADFFRDSLFFAVNASFEDWILQELLAYADIID